MRQTEIAVFEALRRDHPEFEGDVVRWEPGPDPPDFIGTRRDGTRVGIELTEWLDSPQTSASIRRTEATSVFWETLNTKAPARPRNSSLVQVSLKEGARLSKRHEVRFRSEFFQLITHLDDNWEQLLAGYPQPIWTDFSAYPTVATYVSELLFCTDSLIQRTEGNWIIFEATGDAYTPRWAAEALLSRIQTKTARYRSVARVYGLAELILVVHYGLKGILHNTPYSGVNFGLDDILREVASLLRTNHGSFQRVYLYLAFNEGALVQVWPER